MDLSPFGVRAGAGTLRDADGLVLHHSWTDEGVVAAPTSNGAQVLHLAVALCIVNDTYREAQRLGVTVNGVRVEVDGAFDAEWRSSGIEYAVFLDSPASEEQLAHLAATVDEVAEIPRVIRSGAPVARRK